MTVDLDVLDTSIMPGTGTPEVGGLDFKELVGWFKYLSKFNIVGREFFVFKWLFGVIG